MWQKQGHAYENNEYNTNHHSPSTHMYYFPTADKTIRDGFRMSWEVLAKAQN